MNLLVASLKKTQITYISYVEGINHIIIPSQVKKICSAIFVIQPDHQSCQQSYLVEFCKCILSRLSSGFCDQFPRIHPKECSSFYPLSSKDT